VAKFRPARTAWWRPYVVKLGGIRGGRFQFLASAALPDADELIARLDQMLSDVLERRLAAAEERAAAAEGRAAAAEAELAALKARLAELERKG
jgi:hypothetical protein